DDRQLEPLGDGINPQLPAGFQSEQFPGQLQALARRGRQVASSSRASYRQLEPLGDGINPQLPAKCGGILTVKHQSDPFLGLPALPAKWIRRCDHSLHALADDDALAGTSPTTWQRHSRAP